VPGRRGTLAALSAEYFGSAEFANLKPPSQATYRLALGPILERDGHRLVRDLPADKARKLIQEIGANRPAMANLTRAVLRRLFSFAMAIGQRRDKPFIATPEFSEQRQRADVTPPSDPRPKAARLGLAHL